MPSSQWNSRKHHCKNIGHRDRCNDHSLLDSRKLVLVDVEDIGQGAHREALFRLECLDPLINGNQEPFPHQISGPKIGPRGWLSLTAST